MKRHRVVIKRIVSPDGRLSATASSIAIGDTIKISQSVSLKNHTDCSSSCSSASSSSHTKYV